MHKQVQQKNRNHQKNLELNFRNRLDHTEERITDLKHRTFGIIYSEEQKE